MLVVAKGTLIDKSEIYSAVASFRLQKREKGIREVIIEDSAADW